MENMKSLGNKFIIAPCSGVGQTVSTISRQAAYVVVEEMMPNNALLLCPPAFVTNVDEDVKIVEENADRIVVIEGCDRKYMTKILEGRGYKPARQIIVSHVIGGNGSKNQ